jgi:hypothetical protein
MSTNTQQHATPHDTPHDIDKLVGLRRMVYYADRITGALHLIERLGVPIGEIVRTKPDQIVVAIDGRLIEINFGDASPGNANSGVHIPSPEVKAFDPDMNALIQLCHGQLGAPMIHNGGESKPPTAFEPPLSALKLTMAPGSLAMPRTHNWTHVYVTADSSSGPLVTLWGEKYENHEWLPPGGELLIYPGVKHAAVAPFAHSLPAELFDEVYRTTRDNPVLVTEHRTASHHAVDIHDHPEDIRMVLGRVRRLGLKLDPRRMPAT